MIQKDALEILKMGHNVFLTGAAGSGKTYLLNEYIRLLKARGIAVGVTASTGIAATHMGGMTLHSWAGIGIHRTVADNELRALVTKRAKKNLTRAQALVIDEISMLDADRLDLADRVARLVRGSFQPFGGMQVVLCGDFFQLPPVAKEGEPPPRFAFRASAWGALNLKICYLEEQFRHGDLTFLAVLNAIRNAAAHEDAVRRLEGRLQTAPVARAGVRPVHLSSHNVDVDAENEQELRRLDGEEKTYQMESRGIKAIAESIKKGCLAPEELVLKKGAAVMFVKNNFERGYVNGTLGIVIDFGEDDLPVVRTSGGREIAAHPATWSVEEGGKILAEVRQIPLRLAWAITIHKSQGMTLDATRVDLSQSFVEGMGYVALSRVRSLAHLELLGFNDMALRVSPEICVFDQELKQRSKEALAEFRSLPEHVVREKQKVFLRESLIGPSQAYSVEKIRTAHPAAYQKWTSEEEQRLAEAYRAGTPLPTIAKTLGRQRGGISSRLKKLGFIG